RAAKIATLRATAPPVLSPAPRFSARPVEPATRTMHTAAETAPRRIRASRGPSRQSGNCRRGGDPLRFHERGRCCKLQCEATAPGFRRGEATPLFARSLPISLKNVEARWRSARSPACVDRGFDAEGPEAPALLPAERFLSGSAEVRAGHPI